MHGHLVAGEERQVARLISGLVGDGVSMTAVARDVLVLALRDIGEEWRGGRLGISTEHRASGIVDRIPGEHCRGALGRSAVLPTTLAAISLREHHWLVTVSKLHRAAARTTVQLEKLGVRALVGGPGRTLDELQRLARQEQHTTPDSNR